MAFFDDISLWLEIAKWIILIFLAWWWYSWVREKLAFSPLLTLTVSGIVVYFLVIEHPIIGSLGVFGWILLTSGLLFMLPTFTMLWNTVKPKRNPMDEMQRY